MHTKHVLAAVAAFSLALAFAAVATAGTSGYTSGTTAPIQITAAKSPLGPSVLCGAQCDGGGGGWACATANAGANDSYGNNVTVFYHWCFDYQGHTQQGYGYSEKNPCHYGPFYPCGLAYVDYDTDFSNGHRTGAHFNDNLHVLSFVSVGLCVDGYGNAWYC